VRGSGASSLWFAHGLRIVDVKDPHRNPRGGALPPGRRRPHVEQRRDRRRPRADLSHRPRQQGL